MTSPSHWSCVSKLTKLSPDDCEVPSLESGSVHGTGDASSWTGMFSCLPGYSLVGSKTMKCRGGQWSSSVPVCTSLGSCDPAALPALHNGRADPYNSRQGRRQEKYKFSSSHKAKSALFFIFQFYFPDVSPQYRGSVYKYSCNRGYRKWGQGIVHCKGDSWDLSRLPVCHKTGCSEAGLKELVGGEVRRKAEGGIYFYHCTRPGSLLSGSPALVCTQHGWNDTKPSCICKSCFNLNPVSFLSFLSCLISLMSHISHIRRTRAGEPQRAGECHGRGVRHLLLLRAGQQPALHLVLERRHTLGHVRHAPRQDIRTCQDQD